MRSVSNREDFLDSRDVNERIEELETERGEDPDNFVEDEELIALSNLRDQGQYSADWDFGATLIRDTYFTEYAQEFAEDIGAVGRDSQWPVYCIDWERAANELKMDYACVDFDGVDYWVR